MFYYILQESVSVTCIGQFKSKYDIKIKKENKNRRQKV